MWVLTRWERPCHLLLIWNNCKTALHTFSSYHSRIVRLISVYSCPSPQVWALLDALMLMVESYCESSLDVNAQATCSWFGITVKLNCIPSHPIITVGHSHKYDRYSRSYFLKLKAVAHMNGLSDRLMYLLQFLYSCSNSEIYLLPKKSTCRYNDVIFASNC